MTDYARGGLITLPDGAEPSDSIPAHLGEREQILHADGRVSCVYGGNLYRLENRNWNPGRYFPFLASLNDAVEA